MLLANLFFFCQKIRCLCKVFVAIKSPIFSVIKQKFGLKKFLPKDFSFILFYTNKGEKKQAFSSCFVS